MSAIIACLVIGVFAFLACCSLLFKNKDLERQNRSLKLKNSGLHDANVAIEQKLANMKKNFNAEHAHLMSQAVQVQTLKTLQNKLSDNFTNHYKKIGQEFLGNLTDKTEAFSRDLQFSVTDKIWDSFQQLKENLDDTPQILPRNVKAAYTKGCRTVILIEQDPQVRSVSFSGDLLTQSVANKSLNSKHRSEGYRFNLSFPYVIFCIVFDHEKYSHHEVYFRNKTLSSSREHVYLAPLPNIWRNRPNNTVEPDAKFMCMGVDFSGKIAAENTMSRQCDVVISSFWQMTFNGHLGTGGHESIDKRIANFAIWQEESQKDPLFILSVQWTNSKTAKGIVEAALDRRTREKGTDLIDQKIKTILDEGVNKISKGIKEECNKDVCLDLSKFLVDDITKESLDAFIAEHVNKVFTHCTKG